MNNTPTQKDILLSEYISGTIDPKDLETVLEYLKQDQELSVDADAQKVNFTLISKTQHDTFFENAARNTSVHVLQALQSKKQHRSSWKLWLGTTTAIAAVLLCYVFATQDTNVGTITPMAATSSTTQQPTEAPSTTLALPTTQSQPLQTQIVKANPPSYQSANTTSRSLDEVLEDALVDALVYSDQQEDVWAVDEEGISILMEQISHDSSL